MLHGMIVVEMLLPFKLCWSTLGAVSYQFITAEARNFININPMKSFFVASLYSMDGI